MRTDEQGALESAIRGGGTHPPSYLVPEVHVSTATAIIASRDDPYRVVVGDSINHPRPVLPGGKLENKDLSFGVEAAPSLCIRREVFEEVGAVFEPTRLIGVALDPERDVRLVSPRTLASAVITPPIAETVPEEVRIKAHYGCPDYVFLGYIDEASL